MDNFCSSYISKSIEEFRDANFGRKRIPLSGGIELTSKCNLSCIHCYAESSRKERDMTNYEIKKIISQFVEAGTLSIFFTGGEALLRPDFKDLFVFARKKGLEVTVLTNATLITQEIIDLFKEYLVVEVSISMYGYSRETYEAITKVPGSYDKFMRGIKLLRKNNIPFELKTVVMKPNFHEVLKMKNFAKQLNVTFRYTSIIRPMNDGNREPVDLRVSPDEAFWLDVNDEDRRKFWEFIALDNGVKKVSSKRENNCLYLCELGQRNFFISSDGMLRPCTRERCFGYDLRNGSFIEGWNKYITEIADKKTHENFKCLKCTSFKYCEQCTANFELETGNPEAPVSFYCEVANKRKAYCDSFREQRLMK